MTPDKINELFDEETEATPEEAAAASEDARNNPELARVLLQTVYARGTAEPAGGFRFLLDTFLQHTLMQWVEERADADDTFALICGERILDLMEQMKPGWMAPDQAPPPARPARPVTQQRRPQSGRRESRSQRKAKKANAA